MSNEQKEILSNIEEAMNHMSDFNRGRIYERAMMMAEKKEDEQEQKAS